MCHFKTFWFISETICFRIVLISILTVIRDFAQKA